MVPKEDHHCSRARRCVWEQSSGVKGSDDLSTLLSMAASGVIIWYNLQSKDVSGAKNLSSIQSKFWSRLFESIVWRGLINPSNLVTCFLDDRYECARIDRFIWWEKEVSYCGLQKDRQKDRKSSFLGVQVPYSRIVGGNRGLHRSCISWWGKIGDLPRPHQWPSLFNIYFHCSYFITHPIKGIELISNYIDLLRGSSWHHMLYKRVYVQGVGYNR